MPFTVNTITSAAFLGIFIVAFFPALFNTILYLPFLPFQIAYRYSYTTSPATPPSTLIDPKQQQVICDQTLPSRLAVLEENISKMSWFQKSFTLPTKSRGAYLITDEVLKQVPEIKDYKVGLLNLFVQHTSCGLSLNENWDSEVREDMSDALDRLAPEDKKGNLYRHAAEGLDDMPAHIKSALVGASVSVPITNGRLNTGTWQGIWYLEFRASKHSRKVVATIQGEKA